MNRLTNYWTMKAHEIATLPRITAIYLEEDKLPARVAKAKLPGDLWALRGIPVQGRGIGGAIGGTRPDVSPIIRGGRD